MSDAKSSKGLKKEEVEKGMYGTVVELLFVPIHDKEVVGPAQKMSIF